jgi:hypothetical protein
MGMLSAFRQVAGIKSNNAFFGTMGSDQALVEAHKIKAFTEVLTIGYFIKLTITAQVHEIEPSPQTEQ